MKKQSIYVGVATYDTRISRGVGLALLEASSNNLVNMVRVSSSSLLANNFNNMYCEALNMRPNGVTHFMLIHDDLILPPFFVDQMVEIYEKHKADMLSAIIPIKNTRGLTSTALDEPFRNNDWPWSFRRLTLKEIHNDYPPTFTHEKILANSGLILLDITKPWAGRVKFTIEDKIEKTKEGKYQAHVLPEDWYFSRQIRAQGGSIYVTREIKVLHSGRMDYPNDREWGEWETDR